MDEQEQPQVAAVPWLQTVRDALGILRDSIIVMGLLGLLVFPETFGAILGKAGFTEADIGGFHWKRQVEISRRDNVDNLNLAMQAQNAALAGSPERERLTSLVKQLENAVAKDTRVLEHVAPDKIPITGWVYLGSVTNGENQWLIGGAYSYTRTVDKPPTLQKNDIVTFITNTNLRDAFNPDGPITSRITSTLAPGSRAQILNIRNDRKMPAAEGDGHRVWAEIRILPG